MSYKKLEVYQLAEKLVIEIHEMTLKELPEFEKYEVGSQIRRSMKSVLSNIVEGYGRRDYQKQYLQFLIMALASLDETSNHLAILWKTKSFKDQNKYLLMNEEFDKLGRKLTLLIRKIRSDLKNNQ